MIYRQYGKLSVSVLGLELMGLEALARGAGKGLGADVGADGYLGADRGADEYLSAVSRGLELGVNYFDLGFPCFRNAPEKMAACYGALLKDSGVVTALRVNILDVGSPDEAEAYARGALGRYGLSHTVLLQLWDLNRTTWVKAVETGILARLKDMVRGGFADGLTFHFMDDRFYLKPVLDSGDFDGMALEYSLMDVERNAGSLKTADDFGMGVIAHGVLKEGRLAGDSSEIWATCPERSPESWALAIALDKQAVACALVEAFSARQVEEYARCTELADSEKAGVQGLLLAKRVKDHYHSKRSIQCELCRCCMPCPIDVNAPRIAELVNEVLMYGDAEVPAVRYTLEKLDGRRCARCMKCVKACPREFELPDIISEAARLFERWGE